MENEKEISVSRGEVGTSRDGTALSATTPRRYGCGVSAAIARAEQRRPTEMLDANGREIFEGDQLRPVRGHVSMKRFKGLTVRVVYVAPSFCWLWSDRIEPNPYPCANPDHFEVIDPAEAT